jgi:DNA-binding transcriptional LysR family regulator
MVGAQGAGRVTTVHFTLDQIIAFYWIVKLGNFREVGERLGVSQSGISLRIKELERQAGCDLLVRDGSSVTLTARGEVLFTYAEEMVRLRARVSQSFGAPKRPPELLRIGVAESFATIGLFPFLNELSVRRPELSTQISVEHSHVLYGRLLERELDFAFLSVRTVNPSINLVPLCDIELRWAAAPDQARDGQPVSRAELLEERIVTMPPISNIFQYMVDWFDGETPHNLFICNSLATNVKIIASGFGVGIVPVCMARDPVGATDVAFLDTAPHPLDRLYLAANSRRLAVGLLTEASIIAHEAIAASRVPGVFPVSR